MPNSTSPTLLSLPPKMRAWSLTSSGLTLSPSHPLPVPLPSATSLETQPATPTATLTGSNILIKVTHAALNPVDLHILRLFPPWLPFRRDPTPGFDFCGRVVSLGPSVASSGSGANGSASGGADADADADAGVGVSVGVSVDEAVGAGHGELKVGDIVAGALSAGDVFRGKGSLAEYIVVDSSLVTKVPKTFGPKGGEEVTGSEAVGLFGIAGQTAVLMVETAGVPNQLNQEEWKDKKVLVNGASGGVGSILTQILRGKGAEVWGTTGSEEGEALVTVCGGTVINYRAHDPVIKYLAQLFGAGEEKKKLDFIFDCAGSQSLFSHSPQYLKATGKFISIVGGASQGVVPYIRNKLRPVWLGGTPRRFELLLLLPGLKTVREVGRLIREGVIKRGVVDGVYEMEELVKAYERLGEGRAKGKVVVRVSGEE